MKGSFVFLLMLLSCLASAAPTSFWLRNTDPGAEFLYWTVEGSPAGLQAVLPRLALAPGGSHGVAPGERVRIVLAPDRTLVGVFVPWSENLSFRTVVAGGFILGSEAPVKGTLLVDRPSFAAANKGRGLEGPLQQWGLTVPQMALDGRFDDWAKIRPALEWGESFLPGNQPWPSSYPRPRRLQVTDREGALWLHLFSDRPWASFPPGISASLALRRPGAFLEWPLTGGDPTVWLWQDGSPAEPVGWSILRDGDLEAWVPWDRLKQDERAVWTAADAQWSLLLTEKDVTRILDLAPTSPGEWP
jgi:hypothetical protein